MKKRNRIGAWAVWTGPQFYPGLHHTRRKAREDARNVRLLGWSKKNGPEIVRLIEADPLTKKERAVVRAAQAMARNDTEAAIARVKRAVARLKKSRK